jgi:ATP-dependent RNA helicase DDX19/DBP5
VCFDTTKRYLHRIGRSGRFGREGIAINFIHDEYSKKGIAVFSDFFKRDIKELKVQDIETLEGMLAHLNLPINK